MHILRIVLIVAGAIVWTATPSSGLLVQPEAAAEARATDGGHMYEATLDFAATPGAMVYLKVLPTAGNPIVGEDGSHGTVVPDHSSGVSGWWIHPTIRFAGEKPIDLGYYADDQPTNLIKVPASGTGQLHLEVRAPVSAPRGTSWDVTFVLAERSDAEPSQSGATMDQAQVSTIRLAAIHEDEQANGSSRDWALAALPIALAVGTAIGLLMWFRRSA